MEDGARPKDAREVHELTGHLASLSRNQLPLPEGLRALAGELDSSRSRALLNAAATRLELGEDLPAVLRGKDGAMPGDLGHLLEQGMRDGSVNRYLSEYLRHHDLNAELRRRCVSAIAYPGLLLCVLLGLLWFTSVTLAPAFDEIFENASAQYWNMAATTSATAVFAIIHLLAEQGTTIAAVLAMTVAFTVLFVRVLLRPATRSRWIKKLPIVGSIVSSAGLAEFCDMLAILVDASCPLPRGVELAGQSSRDDQISAAASDIRRDLDSGRSLLRSPTAIDVLTYPVSFWIDLASRRGGLAESLRILAKLYESRARSQTRYLAYVLQILLGVLTLWGLLFLFACVFYPLQTMLRFLT